jgi:hypothetical protein
VGNAGLDLVLDRVNVTLQKVDVLQREAVILRWRGRIRPSMAAINAERLLLKFAFTIAWTSRVRRLAEGSPKPPRGRPDLPARRRVLHSETAGGGVQDHVALAHGVPPDFPPCPFAATNRMAAQKAPERITGTSQGSSEEQIERYEHRKRQGGREQVDVA